MGMVCREHGVILVVNGSQGVGALQINVGSEPFDALVSCGAPQKVGMHMKKCNLPRLR